MTSRLLGTALVLGLLSAVGPFAIDMYLPALPGIQRGLHTDVDAAQMSLMVFFAAIAVGQVAYGPVSDMLGRKPPIYFGLCLFALASIGCALAPDIHALIAARFVQGLGACAAMVVPRAIVRDMHTGTEAAKLMALLMLVFIGAFGISSFFANLANSSFVLIEHYGLTPTQYSLAFSVNAVSFIGAAQFTGRLGERFGLRRVVRTAVAGYAATMLLLLGLTVAGLDRLDLLMALLFVGYGFLGLVIPTTAVLALDRHGPVAGTASALMGTLQFVTGAAVIAAVGRFLDGTALPMVGGIAGCSLVAFLLARVTLRRDDAPAMDGAATERA